VLLDPARHLLDLGRFRLERASRERSDDETRRELEARPLGLPEGIDLEWLGVAGYRIGFEGRTLLIDPYFSRVPFSDVIRRRAALPDPALIDRYLPDPGEIEGVLVGHTHFDHAVDAPAIARRFGCKAYGSGSLTRLMALHGLASHSVEVEPHRVYELGPFKVTFVPSAHSKLLLGLAVPYSGELSCEQLDGLAPGAYRCGQVWGIRVEVGGFSFYHQGSAELLDDEDLGGPVDCMLAGIAGRNFARDYWQRILPKLDPRLVVPGHYDDFFRPLDQPMGYVTQADLSGVPGEIAAVSADTLVATLPPPNPGTVLRGNGDPRGAEL
jgi:L-ascorbate metabolism protein UlaG (beta-lactamase superfamily)